MYKYQEQKLSHSDAIKRIANTSIPVGADEQHVQAGTYTNPTITVDAQGRITSITNNFPADISNQAITTALITAQNIIVVDSVSVGSSYLGPAGGALVKGFRPATGAGSGTSFNISALQACNYYSFSSNSPVTITVDDFAVTSDTYLPGSEIEGIQVGTGQITIVAGGVQVIHSLSGAVSTSGQYAHFWLKYVGASTWHLYGDLV